MWIYILVAAAVLALAVLAFWPRKGGIVDADVASARRTSTTNVDSATSNIRAQYPHQ